MLQCFGNRMKGNLVPGYLVFAKKPGLYGFKPGVKLIAKQQRPVIHVHLAYPRHIEHGKQALDFDLRTGFLVSLTLGTCGGGLVHFQKTCGQCPLAKAGFYVALPKQNLVTLVRQGAYDEERVFVMNGVARRAHTTVFGVTIVRHAHHHRGTAIFTMFGGETLHGIEADQKRLNTNLNP